MANAVLLIGLSGSGKGTQAQLLEQRFGWPTVSTGDILREEAGRNTPLGARAREIMSGGRFASDDDILPLLAKAILRFSEMAGVVFEGAPRSTRQARFLDGALGRYDFNIVPIWLDVPERVCRRRLKERGRKDDTPDVIENRFREFGQSMVGLRQYYGNNLRRVCRRGNSLDVFEDICRHLWL